MALGVFFYPSDRSIFSVEFHGKLASGLFFIPIRWDCSEVLGFESEVTPTWQQHCLFFFSQNFQKKLGGNQTIDMYLESK